MTDFIQYSLGAVFWQSFYTFFIPLVIILVVGWVITLISKTW